MPHLENTSRRLEHVQPTVCGRRLKTQRLDLFLGLAVVLLIGVVTFVTNGAAGLLYVGWAWAFARLAVFLWQKKSRAAKVAAVLLVPVILLGHLLLPRETRRAIRRIDKPQA